MSYHVGTEVCPFCGGDGVLIVPRPLTAKQSAIYAYLKAFIVAQGFAPSLEEIQARFGYATMATVHEHLRNLETKGWIRRRFNVARAITLVAEALEEAQAVA